MNKLLFIGAIMMLLVALPGCGNGDEGESAEVPAAIDAPESDSAAQTEEDPDATEAEDTVSEEATEEGEKSEEEPEE